LNMTAPCAMPDTGLGMKKNAPQEAARFRVQHYMGQPRLT